MLMGLGSAPEYPEGELLSDQLNKATPRGDRRTQYVGTVRMADVTCGGCALCTAGQPAKGTRQRTAHGDRP